MSNTTVHVLIVYRYDDHHLDIQQFDDIAEATAAYAEMEALHVKDADKFEVVLVGADSLATIEKTHGHYFAKAADSLTESLFSEFLR
ncbi:hypothetical protein HMPREF0063_11511 [Aeromicrobium marinum DSM 15272]|uniref:Uncharacterized protein n=1 Tax=Aeromicrobium marinum DSM 15272 TaxID=585531 RepID=E2SBV2_9ACTN|nr:hypothetical protein [Aeromicrobium marinum]EFQ83238.1 hypothetical protein HMPREF0063_11511 [Aeromicrobium marinum DSM 15272]